MRRLRRGVFCTVIGAVGVVLTAGGSLASGTGVSMVNKQFTPSVFTIKLGSAVTWTNIESTARKHTTTSDGFGFHGEQGLGLWDSGTLYSGQSFTYRFTAAGRYPYHCVFHLPLAMIGTVSVPLYVSPASGPPGTQFTITIASQAAPTGFVYDVQKKDPAGTYEDWMLGGTSPIVTFDSTGLPAGSYGFRSRLRRVSDDGASDYSGARPATVT